MEALRGWLAEAEMESGRLGRPLVTLSYAQSLDGCLTVERGRPTHLSGEETRRLTHGIRAAHDGILVGIGTVLADDPQLNTRMAPGKDPRPVVLDTHLRIPDGCRLLERETCLPWIITGQEIDEARASELEQRGVSVMRAGTGMDGRVDLRDGLERLLALGVRSLMVEGGAGVITSFLRARLVDQVVVTIAPVYLGGLKAVEESVSQTDDTAGRLAPRLADIDWAQIGGDLVVWGRVREGRI